MCTSQNHAHPHTHQHADNLTHTHENGLTHTHEGLPDHLHDQVSTDPDSVVVMTAVYGENDRIASLTNQRLSKAGILTVNVMGAPGVGKTSSIISLISELPDWQHYVIEGDIESDLDTQTLRQRGVKTLQINTHGACHLDSPLIARTIEDFEMTGPGLLLIENIGNLVCPAEFLIGEHFKMLIVSVTDGSDKPYKYPLAFEKADVIILNKTDLLPYVDFDQEFFMAGIRALNPDVPVIPVNARKKEGFAAVADWFRSHSILSVK